MARRQRRARGRRSGGMARIAVGTLLLVLAALVGGGFAYLKLTTPVPPKLEAGTLCPVDGERSITVVLVDASDDLPEAGRQQVMTRLSDIADTLPQYGRLELRVLSPEVRGGIVKFDRCNPGDGSNVDALTGNQQMAHKRWADGFKAPLQAALLAEFSPAKADVSPIMETIQAIAIDRFTGRSAETIPKRLVSVSDMIEYERSYSQYRGDLSYDRFRNSSAYRQYRTDLGGATVDIEYVQRLKPPIDGVAHMAFWQAWVHDNDGTWGAAEKLQGVN
jgi:hypothetical protein